MKLKILFLIGLIGIPVSHSRACDICGCGAGNSYIGILPEFNQNIAGIRYRYNALLTHMGSNGEHTYLTTDERYQIAEVWGGVTLGQRFRIMGTLPYAINSKTHQSHKMEKNGLGDASLWAYYQPLNYNSAIFKSKMLIQSLWIGGGLKLPTGQYAEDEALTKNDANLFQLGTGSVDFMLGGIYDLRLQDVGISLNASYKMNTSNKYAYRYSNKLSGSVQFYYKFNIQNRFTFSPNTGLIYEHAGIDTRKGRKVLTSGGSILLAGMGLEGMIKNKAVWGASYHVPVRQDLAYGIVQAKDRVMVHIGWMF